MKGETPSAILFDKLGAEVAPDSSVLRTLPRISRVAIVDKGYFVKVGKVTGNRIHFIPTADLKTGQKLPKIPKQPERTSTLTYVVSDKSRAALWTTPPVRIGLMGQVGLVADVNFVRDDPNLDKLLLEGLKLFPKLDTLEALKDSTSWVHERLPYDQESPPPEGNTHPLGEVLERYRVCKEIVGF